MIVLIALLCLILPGFYTGLNVVHYQVDAEALAGPVRIAFVSDLHSCAYGQGMRELIDAVDRESPDIVLLGGDLFDDALPEDNTVDFVKGIAGKYPCYYATGNHEYLNGAEVFAARMELLEGLGVVRLNGSMDTVDIRGSRLNICGVDDVIAWTGDVDPQATRVKSLRAQVEGVTALPKDGDYTILLAHRPEMFEDIYCASDCDLILAGHAHGGQWRIPGLVNGLYAPYQGWFPQYAGGLYERDGKTMIVSRGLARESTDLPRFYNRPELVIVDLRPAE